MSLWQNPQQKMKKKKAESADLPKPNRRSNQGLYYISSTRKFSDQDPQSSFFWFAQTRPMSSGQCAPNKKPQRDVGTPVGGSVGPAEPWGSRDVPPFKSRRSIGKNSTVFSFFLWPESRQKARGKSSDQGWESFTDLTGGCFPTMQ